MELGHQQSSDLIVLEEALCECAPVGLLVELELLLFAVLGWRDTERSMG